MQAHEIQVKMAELKILDDIRIQNDKEIKIKKELDKLKCKHENENNNFNLKLNQHLSEFTKKRALDMEK